MFSPMLKVTTFKIATHLWKRYIDHSRKRLLRTVIFAFWVAKRVTNMRGSSLLQNVRCRARVNSPVLVIFSLRGKSRRGVYGAQVCLLFEHLELLFTFEIILWALVFLRPQTRIECCCLSRHRALTADSQYVYLSFSCPSLRSHAPKHVLEHLLTAYFASP